MLAIWLYHTWWGSLPLSLASSKPSIYTYVFSVLTICRFQDRGVSYLQGDNTQPTLVCTLLASADFSRQALLHGFGKQLITTSVRPPRIMALAFHLMPTSFFRKLKETPPTVPNSYRALVCSATLPTVICLVWSFCSLGQMFAAGFLQIPPRDGHPCLWLWVHFKKSLLS